MSYIILSYLSIELTTWRKMIEAVAAGDKVIFCTLSRAQLDIEFNSGFGNIEGASFTGCRARSQRPMP